MKFSDKLLERIEKVDSKQLKQYYQALMQDNNFLEGVIYNLNKGVIVLDGERKIRLVNSTAEHLLGVSAKKIKGRLFDECPFDKQIISFVKGAIKNGELKISTEIHVQYPGEQSLSIALSSIDDEKSSGWIVELEDISGRIKTRMNMVQNEKIKALVTLSAALAHELGNPLNSVSIHLQLLEREIKKLAKKGQRSLTDLLKIAKTEIKRLDGIVTQFLNATAPFKPRFVKAHVHDIILETLAFMSHEIKKENVKIEKSFYDDIPEAYLDYIQIKQAFINIIKNALESMPGKGMLAVSTSMENEKIKISFRDNGVGVPKNQLGKVFEPYYTTKEKGSGLGLMVVHRIISEHGGQIMVNSELGKGTDVSIYLPTVPPGPKLLTVSKSREEK